MDAKLFNYKKRLLIIEFVNKLNLEFGIEYSVIFGNKYAKILSMRSAWGFIVLEDTMPNKNHPGYKRGDLLKAASYNSPSRWARGNIFKGTAAYTKYGPYYLK